MAGDALDGPGLDSLGEQHDGAVLRRGNMPLVSAWLGVLSESFKLNGLVRLLALDPGIVFRGHCVGIALLDLKLSTITHPNAEPAGYAYTNVAHFA
jgi:hypothetical protein